MALLGAAVAVVVFAAYMVGSSRPFGFDEAASFAYGVATPDFFDALGASLHGPYSAAYVLGTNDHVLVSVISHSVYSLTQVRDEWVYRVFPTACAAGAVGVTAAALRSRFGLVATLAAAGFMATNPLFVENGRVMRGYGPAVLLCLLASLVLLRRRWSGGWLVLYATLILLAGAAHVFALVILPIHLGIVLAVDRAQRLRFMAAAVPAGLAGLAVNAGALWANAHAGHIPPRLLQPAFVPLLPLYLLGGTALFSLGIWLTAFALAIAGPARQAVVWVAIAGSLLVAAAAAYIAQPPYLYPRFFLFLLPGAAYCIAAAVRRWPLAFAPLSALAAGYAIWTVVPTYIEPEYPLKQAAAIIDAVHVAGGTACLLPPDNNTMPAYTTSYLLVSTADRLNACDVVLLPGADADPELKNAAIRQFPQHRTLPAVIPGYVLWRLGNPAPPES